jgi:von Willebrand factor type A domain-containing protein
MRRTGKLVLGLAAAGLAAGALPATGSAATCTKATNIEAIVDDSGSMAVTDPNRLRVQAMDLLINALGNGTTLGAIEFGSADDFATPPVPAADPVFNPEAVGPNAAAMKGALDKSIQADNGATDYNAAFNTARAANPGAQARIFLTDGGHDVGAYADAHLNPTPPQTPTYVVGFSVGVGAPEDQARLQQIATDTGGKYFPLPDSSALQSVMDQIEAILTCQSAPKTFTDKLAQGKSRIHSVTIAPRSRTAQLALSWTSPLDQFTISGLKIVRKGKTVAVAARHKRKLKVSVKRGATFVVVKVQRLVKGKLRFKVKAAHIGSGAPKVSLTTQVSQAKH